MSTEEIEELIRAMERASPGSWDRLMVQASIDGWSNLIGGVIVGLVVVAVIIVVVDEMLHGRSLKTVVQLSFAIAGLGVLVYVSLDVANLALNDPQTYILRYILHMPVGY